MSEKIITLLSVKENMSLTIEDICKKLGIKDKELVQKELNKMVETGILDYSPKKKKYLLFENSHLYQGRISFDKYGNGQIRITNKEVCIPKKNLNGANYNDLVAAELENGGTLANVIRIIERDKANYVFEVINKNGRLYMEHPKLGIKKINDNSHSLVEGDKILVHRENGLDEILSVIGHKDDPGVDLESIICENGFPLEFSEKALKELEDIPNVLTNEEIKKEISNGRVDFRDRTIITMDCDDTKDIDDGISIRQLADGGIELGVYIADVAHYIKEGSYLDREAYERGTSVYPPGSVVPQLPHKISNGICSLNPDTDRLAMCYITKFDSKGNVKDFNIVEGIIHSKYKMTYSAVNKILEDEELVEGYGDFLKELYLMQKLSLLIQKNLTANGFLSFDTTEGKVILDEEYHAIDITKRENRTAQKIIEYFMIITNIELTKYAHSVGLPWIYRIHGLPNQDRLESAFEILKHNHYISDKNKHKKYYSNDLQKAIKELSTKENREIFYQMFVMSQDKAKYSVDNIGHFAIGADYYSHNTSPIRRGPDLSNQRVLKTYLHKGIEEVCAKYRDLYDQAGHYSSRERAAAKCERDATDMKKAEYMESHVGEVYQGYISYVGRFGFFVMLDNTIEGFIRLSELPKGKYTYNEELLCLENKSYNFSIGDKVEVYVKKADKNMRSIEFGILVKEYQKDEKKGKKKVKTK